MIPTFLKDRKGNIYLNEMARYVKGTIVAPAASQIPVVTPAMVGTVPGAGTTIVLEGSGDGCTELYSATGYNAATDDPYVVANLTTQITDTAWRRRLMNQPVLAAHVFGTAQQPFYLPQSIFLEMQQTLQFQFFNNSTNGPSNFSFMFEGRKFQTSALADIRTGQQIKEMRVRARQLYPYWLTTDIPISVPANGSVTTFMTVDQSIWFLGLTRMCEVVLNAGSPPTWAGDKQECVTFQLFDGQTERPLQNQPVPLNCFAGTAEFPYMMPTGFLLPPNSKIKLQVNSLLVDGGPTTVYFTIHGVGCYNGGMPPLTYTKKTASSVRAPMDLSKGAI